MSLDCGKLFSIFSGLEGLVGQLAMAYIVIMLYKSGIDKEFIGLLFSIYLITVLFSDYPTGGFADTLGRRGIHALGLFLEGLSLLLISIFNYIGSVLILAFIVSGIGFAMMSGSLSAWFVDEAKKLFDSQDDVRKYMEKYFSLSYGLNSGLGLIGGLVASLISIYGITYPVLVGGILYMVLALNLILLAKENYGRVGHPFETVIEGGKLTIKNPNILLIIVALSLVGGAFMIFAVSWQLFLADLYSLPQWSYGIIFSIMLVAMTFGSLSAKYFTKAFSYVFLLPLIIIVLASSYVLMGLFYNMYLTIILFLVLEYALGVFRPVSSVLINELIPSDVRATILSLYSTVNSIFSSGGSYLAGYMAKSEKYDLLYILSGLITIISIPIIIRPIKTKERE